MKLSSTVSQNVRIFVSAAVIAVGAMGCGGSNDNTAGGTAGTAGGTAGTAGGAGSGGAGSSGTACSLADVNNIFITTSTNLTTGCTVIGSCHDNSGAAAGLDLTSAGWQTKLVGKSPSATAGADSAALKSMCAGMNLVYLIAGSKPAEGLLIDKIKPGHDAPCGVHMPNFGVELSATQFACVQSYLTTLTSP